MRPHAVSTTYVACGTADGNTTQNNPIGAPFAIRALPGPTGALTPGQASTEVQRLAWAGRLWGHVGNDGTGHPQPLVF